MKRIYGSKRQPRLDVDHGVTNKEFGSVIAARNIVLEGIHGIDVMVPSIVTSVRTRGSPFAVTMPSSPDKKETLNWEDKFDEVVNQPLILKRSRYRISLKEGIPYPAIQAEESSDVSKKTSALLSHAKCVREDDGACQCWSDRCSHNKGYAEFRWELTSLASDASEVELHCSDDQWWKVNKE